MDDKKINLTISNNNETYLSNDLSRFAAKDLLYFLEDVLKHSKDFYITFNTNKTELEKLIKRFKKDIDVMNIFRKYLSISLSKISCNEFISDEEYFKIKEWLLFNK